MVCFKYTCKYPAYKWTNNNNNNNNNKHIVIPTNSMLQPRLTFKNCILPTKYISFIYIYIYKKKYISVDRMILPIKSD